MQSPDPKTPAVGSDYDDAHPEQDPAEGSSEVIESDLAEADGGDSDSAAKDGENGAQNAG